MYRSKQWYLKMKAVIDGRLVMVETQQKCYYRYVIFPSDKEDHSRETEPQLIKSSFTYTNGLGAFSAGKKAAKKEGK